MEYPDATFECSYISSANILIRECRSLTACNYIGCHELPFNIIAVGNFKQKLKMHLFLFFKHWDKNI
jgi:hypothetical protein